MAEDDTILGGAEDDARELAALVEGAEAERHPQTRARLWGEAIGYVLALEDIREGLTFEKIARMSDADANDLADHIRAVLRFERSWRS